MLVPDKQLYLFRIKNYSDDGINFDDDFIQEIGMPYVRYPLFSPLPDIDYIIANPTPFSFVSLQDRLEYLDRLITVVKVLTNRGDRIAYKPHNADERHDYIVNKYAAQLLSFRFFGWLARASMPFLRHLIASGAQLTQKLAIEICIAQQYKIFSSHIIHLSELTKFHRLNLEIFLPFVRKGLITGRSNSIWHGLFCEKEVWNLVDGNKQHVVQDKMHRYSMNYFNVHWDESFPKFATKQHDRVAAHTRDADFIAFVDQQLSFEKTDTQLPDRGTQ